jgi:hypothetical protein
MKKVIALVIICLVASTTMALAIDILPALDVNKPMPERVARDGSCAISAFPDSATTIGIWGSSTFNINAAAASYVNPAIDMVDPGGCTAPFYPFHATSVDLYLVVYNDDTTEVGRTVTYRIDFACPKDFSSGSATEDCQGPGDVFATYTMTHVMVRDDWDADGIGNIILVNTPVDVCVDRPFFVIVTLTSWDGANDGSTTGAPTIIWHRYEGVMVDQPGERCDNWLSLPVVGYSCWLLSGFDIGFGCTTPPPGFSSCQPGATYMYINGNAGEPCTPATCSPLPNNYPGDDASNPIVVNSTPWEATINLCDYTSDYNYYDDAGAVPTTQRRFTGRGNDVVLEIAYDPGMPQACWAITLTPQCTAPDILRLRTWLYDATYGYTLDWGNPQYPAANAAQDYNSCDLPDTYLLYIDGYPCCCPVHVLYGGDQPLPVELTSFDAVPGDGFVTITWTTASERDMDFFQIMRDGDVLTEVSATNIPSGHTYTYTDRDVVNGTTYRYQLSAQDINGGVTLWPQTESATPRAGIVDEYALHQNYPNPFNPTTSISYSVKEAGFVTLKVYTVDGREVATLVNANQTVGLHTVDFNGSDLASGVYLYKLEVNGFSATHKMVLMK